MMTDSIQFKPTALALALAAIFPISVYGAAGHIDFVVGDVKALAADGRARILTKGDEFNSGETIETGNGGRVWLRFTDGAQVSLQPQSQYRIDNYKYNGKVDGEERGFFSLLKGALRTITGYVGRTNRSNYKVNTSVATIGIRGTEYSIAYGNSITVSTGEGEVEVCNNGGCLLLTGGESGYVANKDTKPTLTNKRVDLPPMPELPLPQFSVANNTDGSGGAAIMSNALSLPSGPGYALSAANANFMYTGYTFHEASGTATFNSGNGLTAYTGGVNTITPGSVTDAGTDGVMGWGRWTSGTVVIMGIPYAMADMAYVVGVPTPVASMPASGTATYTMTGATSAVSGGTSATLNSATLTANFSTQQLSGVLNMSFGSTGFSGIAISGNSFSGSDGSCSFSGGGSCTTKIDGFFAGTAAARAGLSYRIEGSAMPGTFTGSAAFKQ